MLFGTSENDEDQSRVEIKAKGVDMESQKDLELAEKEQALPLEIQEKRRKGILRTGFTTGTSATAATKAAPAAAIAKILSGIRFPKKKEEVVAYARKNKRKLENPEEVLGTINEIPDRTYRTIVEVEKAIGKVR